MTSVFNSESLGYMLDQAAYYSPYIALLYQNPSRIAEQYTVDGSGYLTLTASTPELKTATGKRLTITTAASLPSQSVFFMIPHSSNSAKFKIAASLADALAGTAISVATSSAGTAYDLAIDADDSIYSLVSYELDFSGYGRQLSSLGTATFTAYPAAPKATKVGSAATFSNYDSSTFECTHILALYGGSSTPGATSSNYYGVAANTGLTTIPIGNYAVTLTMEAVNG